MNPSRYLREAYAWLKWQADNAWLASIIANAPPARFWACKAHPKGLVDWVGDVATCQSCCASNQDSCFNCRYLKIGNPDLHPADALTGDCKGWGCRIGADDDVDLSNSLADYDAKVIGRLIANNCSSYQRVDWEIARKAAAAANLGYSAEWMAAGLHRSENLGPIERGTLNDALTRTLAAHPEAWQ